MNRGFYKDLDTNFELACKMSEQEFTHEEILQMLETGNIPEKQIAAIKLDKINNANEALLLLDNLTGCDGKIREAIALKINQLLTNDTSLIKMFTNNSYITFANATIDINGNICKLIIDSVSILKQDKIFAEKYINQILTFIDETFKELDKFIFRDKKYVINKQLFKLYWCLESLKLFIDEISDDILLPILERASKESEYTIREKVAQIITNKKSEKFNGLLITLKSDENYYVREALKC